MNATHLAEQLVNDEKFVRELLSMTDSKCQHYYVLASISAPERQNITGPFTAMVVNMAKTARDLKAKTPMRPGDTLTVAFDFETFDAKSMLDEPIWPSWALPPNDEAAWRSNACTSAVKQPASDFADSLKYLTSILPKADKEIPMSSTNFIQTKTFVNGVDISTMSDEAVYGLIGSMEKQIKSYDELGAKPASLVKKIETIKSNIAALVKLIDERDAAKDKKAD
jgi:hypothetical protein